MIVTQTSFWIYGKPQQILLILKTLSKQYQYVQEIIDTHSPLH